MHLVDQISRTVQNMFGKLGTPNLDEVVNLKILVVNRSAHTDID